MFISLSNPLGTAYFFCELPTAIHMPGDYTVYILPLPVLSGKLPTAYPNYFRSYTELFSIGIVEEFLELENIRLHFVIELAFPLYFFHRVQNRRVVPASKELTDG